MLVVPVYNLILTPDATLYFPIDQLRRSAGSKGLVINEKVVLIMAKSDEAPAVPGPENFFPIGVAGILTELNGQGYAVIRTQYRVNIEDVAMDPDRSLQLTISRRAELDDLDPKEEREKLAGLKEEMRKFSSGFGWKQTAEYIIDQIDSVGMAGCVMSPLLDCGNEERYAILAEDSREKRAEMIEKLLYEFMEVGRITIEANSSQQQEIQQRYKEAAVRRQIELLQK